MEYTFETIKIAELINYIDKNSLDLSPSFQRDFIWTLNDQKALITTINKNYPLPNLFINKKSNGKLEMVDGQQRSRTIFRFYKNEIKYSFKENQNEINMEAFMNYRLPVVFISNALDEEIRDFYVLINKQGKFLNNPEVQRSEFHDTQFLKLSQKIVSLQEFINLDLFNETTIIRLNDRDFVQELLGYLYMYKKDVSLLLNKDFEGLRDKKSFIENEIYKNDITIQESLDLENEFVKIIKRISTLNSIRKLNTTRFKQRNDFFTLFTFLHRNINISDQLLQKIYNILLILNEKDKNGNQFIRPTNEDCDCLKKYAQNCVTQSNSKKARIERLEFFESILLNKVKNEQENEILFDLLVYLGETYGEENIKLIKIEDYYLLDVKDLNLGNYEF